MGYGHSPASGAATRVRQCLFLHPPSFTALVLLPSGIANDPAITLIRYGSGFRPLASDQASRPGKRGVGHRGDSAPHHTTRVCLRNSVVKRRVVRGRHRLRLVGVLVVDTAMKLLMVFACPTTGAQVAVLLRGGLEAYRKFNPVRVTRSAISAVNSMHCQRAMVCSRNGTARWRTRRLMLLESCTVWGSPIAARRSSIAITGEGLLPHASYKELARMRKPGSLN